MRRARMLREDTGTSGLHMTQRGAYELHILHKNEHHANEGACDVEEEFCRISVREDTANPGKIVDEVHNRNLRLTSLLDDYKRTHLHSPDGDQIQYQK